MIAAHFDAEVAKKVESDNRVVFEFIAKPNQDNHLFDCAVGARVAASMCGVTSGREKIVTKKRKKARLAP
jgi:hypothetical protein